MNRSHYFVLSLLLAVLFVHKCAAFQNSRFPFSSCRSDVTSVAASISPEEERAAALSDYLAKSHIEKLRAIKDVEMKKNSEIDQLKQQIAELKDSKSPTSSMVMVNGGDSNVKALEEMSKEELVTKIAQYQNFMRQYMIDAQEQKYRAVKAAEDSARKKLAESMTLLGLSPSDGGMSIIAPSSSPLYAARNVMVSKAAAAGQSRWGPLEVERASSGVTTPALMASAVTQIPSSTASFPPLYAARNAAVAKAAAAGQSRWGSAEVQRALVSSNGINGKATMSVNGGSAPVMKAPAAAIPSPVASIPVPPEVAEADHGLRSDGSVGGLSLAERVFFGASPPAVSSNGAVAPISIPNPPEVVEADHGLRSDGSVGGLTLAERVFYGASPPSAAGTSSSAPMADPRESLFARRNLKVLEAAKAGHSRWGSQEIDRVASIVAITPQLPSVEAPVIQSQRINFGAAILGRQ